MEEKKLKFLGTDGIGGLRFEVVEEPQKDQDGEEKDTNFPPGAWEKSSGKSKTS